MENIKAKIQGILLNCSQKSLIGWAVEEDDFEHVAEEIVKKLFIGGVVKSLKDKETPHFYDWLKENKVDFFADLLLYKDEWLTIGDLYVKYKKEFNIPF